MSRLWRDTLFRRLFLLMWAALVLSHFAAYWAVTRWAQPGRPPRDAAPATAQPHDRPAPPPGMQGRPPPPRNGPPPEGVRPAPAGKVPTFPSLPPTPGLTDGGAAGPPGGSGSPGLPASLLALDYGIRLLLIGLAAWFGAAWLARPVQRLVAAARTLGQGIHPGRPLPKLDAARGTVEVKEAAQVFNTMAEQLQAQFHARGLLMAAISHDLRTPLTRMRMRLERMDDGDATRRCIADIHEMDALIASSLQVFRTLDGAEPTQPTDLFALLQSLTDDLTEAGQPVALEGAPQVAPVQVLAMRRAIDNLVQNALRYGGNARVALHAGPRITVDDDGPGIPEAELQAVFEPFYRVEGSRNRHTGGTGLGLYIARELLARQGWLLTLHNRPGGGLRAELRVGGETPPKPTHS